LVVAAQDNQTTSVFKVLIPSFQLSHQLVVGMADI
jgi:hypothetical protein